MSLATLARKTKTKQRLRTRGKFILNMTGRGSVLGMNAKMSRGNCKNMTSCAGKRASCCLNEEAECCRFPHGGKPAPQMGYGVYLNRKSQGAYHPSGGRQCDTVGGCSNSKPVWKQLSNLDASFFIANKKDKVLACNRDIYTGKKETGCVGQCDCPVKKNMCGCRATDLVRYTRINQSFGCGVTKVVKQSRTAGEQIARNRAAVDCIKPSHRTIHLNAVGDLSFDGCCGNQCLILGQHYSLQVVSSKAEIITIEWCQGVSEIWNIGGSGTHKRSFTVPKFNNTCKTATYAKINISGKMVLLNYCKQGLKKPLTRGC
uniref:Uncharacterized protein n=1 Tax=viral metagenome TaxID=1070528 RepID=A0A6C0C4J5_9ZZZZ